MQPLERTRVADSAALEELSEKVKELMETAEKASQDYESQLSSLSGLCGRVPGEYRESSLQEKVQEWKGKVPEEEYGEVRERTERLCRKLMQMVPLYDVQAAKVQEGAGERIAEAGRKAEELTGLILEGVFERPYAEFREALAASSTGGEDDGEWQTDRAELYGRFLHALLLKDPVNAGTGNFLYEEEDLAVCGRTPLRLVRTYNALDRSRGVLGRGWRHSYEQRVRWQEDGTGILELPDGKRTAVERKGGKPERDGLAYRGEDGILRVFDGSGRCLYQEDAAGGQVVFRYDGEGRLSEVRTEDGAWIAFTYGEDGRPAAVSDHTGREVRYLYENGRLAGTEGPEGKGPCYRYGKNNRMERVETAGGEVLLENRYDGERRVSRQELPDGESLSFFYDGRGRIRTRDGEGREERIRVDRAGRLLVRERDGKKEERSYDGEGRLVYCRDGCGGEETFAYDGKGRLCCHTLPGGEEVRLGYGMEGRLVLCRDTAGRRSADLYGKDGRMAARFGPCGERLVFIREEEGGIRILHPDGGEDRITRDACGNIGSIRPAGQGEHTFRYDRLNRLVEHRWPDGSAVRYGWDGRDRLCSVSGRDGSLETFRYGAGRLPIGRTRRDGSTEEYAWDSQGRLARHVDGAGTESRFFRDRGGLPVRLERRPAGGGDPLVLEIFREQEGRCRIREGGEETVAVFDGCGRLARLEGADGSTAEYVRDACGRLKKVLRGGRTEVAVEWDRGGRPSCIRGNGKEVRFSWDASDRILCAEDQDGNRLEQDYDRCGRPVRRLERRADGKERTLYYRWGKGGLLEETEGTDGTWYRYVHDACGRLARREDRQGNAWTYAYDRGGRLWKETDPYGRSRQYERDPEGRCIRRTDTLGRVTAYRYDGAGRLCAVTDPCGETAEYRYDREGRPHRTDLPQGTGDRERIPGRFPEELRLSMEEEERPEDADWENGIRRRVRFGKCGELVELCYSDREGVLDRLCYEWDGEGQLVRMTAERRGLPQESGRHDYRYDPAGRLTWVEKDGKPLREYRYDREGNRTCLIHYGPDGKEAGREETDREGTAGLERGLAEGGVSGYDGRESEACLFLRDHLGSPLRRISADGSVTAGYAYDEFGRGRAFGSDGEPLSWEGAAPRQGYAGYYQEADGTLRAGCRRYDPYQGRFLEPDPVTGSLYEPQSQNPYVYAGNSPLSWVDRTGAYRSAASGAPSDFAVKAFEMPSRTGTFSLDGAGAAEASRAGNLFVPEGCPYSHAVRPAESMEPGKDMDELLLRMLQTSVSVYVPQEDTAVDTKGLTKELARTVLRICGEKNAAIGMVCEYTAEEGEESLSCLSRVRDLMHFGLQDGRNVMEADRHMEERAAELGIGKEEYSRRYLEVQKFWKEGEEGFFNGYWWQDDEKLERAYEALSEEAELTGGIDVFEEGTRHNEENPSNKIFAIQAMFNAPRSGYFDEALLTQLENVMANRGNGRDIHEMDLTLDKEALDTGWAEHGGIIGKESGDWLERNPAFRDMWEEMAFAIALAESEKGKQEKLQEEQIPEEKITKEKIPENTLKETAGGGEVKSSPVLEGSPDVYGELDELEKSYDEIFERQRTTCQEYESYVDELRELQTESDILFESGSTSINPNEIRYSQSSVNGSSDIIQSMKANGWQGDPIDVVEMPDGIYTTIDNTRVVSAREAGIKVEANVHGYNDPLPSEYIERFTTKKGVPKTWGEAIELRVGKQKASFRNGNPYGKLEMETIK